MPGNHTGINLRQGRKGEGRLVSYSYTESSKSLTVKHEENCEPKELS